MTEPCRDSDVTDYLLDTETLPSWRRYLRAANTSEHTVKGYGEGILAFIRWADRTEQPRARRTHKLASTPTLWLGADNWRTFSYAALHRTLQARADAAGIVGFRPHRMRHTVAPQWLRANGSEQRLMAVAGWSSRTMLDRYIAATAAERVAAEARGLGLGYL
jgi:hypothetical protein